MDLSTLKLVVDLGSFGIISWIVVFWLPRAFGSIERLNSAFIADSKAQREEARADMAAQRVDYRAEIREERDRFIRALDAQRSEFIAVLQENTKQIDRLATAAEQ